MTAFSLELVNYIKSRYSLLVIETFEEERALSVVNSIGCELAHRVFLWNSTVGVQFNASAVGEKTYDFKAALDFCEEKANEKDTKNLFVFSDAHSYLKSSCNPVYRRRLRDFAINIRTKGYRSNCLLISPPFDLPVELQKEATIVELPLPSREDVRQQIGNFIKSWSENKSVTIDVSESLSEKFVDAALGLTAVEIDNCLSRTLVSNLRLDANGLCDILDEKKQIIRKSGILEYIDASSLDLTQVGGLSTLKKWLDLRSRCFKQEAIAFGIKPPKGMLLTGIPGCGKSLTAKCVAATWSMPLLRLDLGKIFQGVVGSSESNMRSALKAAESISPCILWIDEIEKGLSGSSNGSSDGGTATRVFGTLLTWMQEKVAPVFVLATANTITGLPPELLRKGRFDEIFFVDFPTTNDRKKILEIHLRKIGRDPSQFDIDRLAELSGETHLGNDIILSGAEIEAWVGDALIEAFSRKASNPNTSDLAMSDFEITLSRLVPMAKMRKDEFVRLREWADQNAVRASSSCGSATGVSEVHVGGRLIDF